MDKKSIREFAKLAASKEPVPGGGGVSAAVGALASSLGEMVTNLTIGKAKYLIYTDELSDIRKELENIRNGLLDCINGDAEAFKPLAEVYASPKDSEGYEEKMEERLRNAANSPLLILRHCMRIIELDERLAVIGSKLSVSDAATSVMLAHGAMYGAHVNVLVNTRLMKDREYARNLDKETAELLEKYSVLALNVYDDICKRLTNG
ncbi:MAG: cyclodeaminase/cyclohydrolase family protein [Erysipelotrichaceae bacterium]|nr:cyclodeaminase/cyclohydrolase family protein [Erysipelotrichaceae bacterium]